MESKLALQGPFVFTVKPDRPMFLTRKQVSPMVILIVTGIVLFVVAMTHQVPCCPGFCQRYVACSLACQRCASAQEL
jgi:hypothetical protein